MAGKPVAVVQRMLAAFARRDVEAVVAEADPAIQVRPAVIGGLEGTVYGGHDGVRDFLAELDETWGEFRVTPEEFRDLGSSVLVLGRTSARGMQSGVDLDVASGFLFGVRGDKVLTLSTFVTREAALAAAGLSR